ncbi:MAG TPA: hypothetical protein VN494_04365 [Patescibacteria group bacterium]|nr:hypothetical protein [Patescibacteria group bacterium]
MRRKAAVTFVAIMVTLSLAGVAFATHLITGEVILADPSAETLVINVQGHEMTFSVVNDNAVKDLANLKPGAKVAVGYTIGNENRPRCHHVFPWPVGG